MERKRVLKQVWNLSIIIAGIMLIYLTFSTKSELRSIVPNQIIMILIIFLMGFFAEYIDSSLGMGYGTTLTPILMILGFSPLEVVPAVLFSEFLSGITAGVLHHKANNVNFINDIKAKNILKIMTLCSVLGTVIAIILALNLPKQYVKLYIALMILGIGIFIFLGKKFIGEFRWWKITCLGTLAAFNKGISGGGYGPLVTGGQILVGVKEKAAISITSLAEGLVCLAGLVLYILFKGDIYWFLAIPLSVGALLSVPAAVITVKLISAAQIRANIGYVTIFLGVLSLLKIIIN